MKQPLNWTRILIFSLGWMFGFMALTGLLILIYMDTQPSLVGSILTVLCGMALWPMFVAFYVYSNCGTAAFFLMPVLVPAGFILWGFVVELIYHAVAARHKKAMFATGRSD